MTNPESSQPVAAIPLGALVLRCRAENALYLQRLRYDPAYCFEIWRRAIQARDQEAWEAVYNTYTSFVRNWLQKQTGKVPTLRLEENILINGVFFRMMRFVTPEKFQNFPTLSSLMKYLQMCCLTEVQDTLRDYQSRSLDVSLEAGFSGDDEADEGNSSPASRLSSGEDIEQSATNTADRGRFWEAVEKNLPDKADKAAVYARFIYQLPPREIANRYPQYFQDVDAVYRCLKNAIWRLRHDLDLEAWLDEK